MRTETSQGAAAGTRSHRLMWITPERLFYVGLLGAPSTRTMGTYMVYVSTLGARIKLQLEGGACAFGEVAVVPPYIAHRVLTDARQIHVVKVEAEAVDACKLPHYLAGRGIVVAPAFAAVVRNAARSLCAGAAGPALEALDFDRVFFGHTLASRSVDQRIQTVIDRIKRDPSGSATAEECAEAIHLSISRFLHLFKQEVGAPFRSFRTWKRARSLLHHVNRDANLAHVALDTGYPDSTHFSHSIRAIYGLKPRDIFAGSRRLAILDPRPPLGVPTPPTSSPSAVVP